MTLGQHIGIGLLFAFIGFPILGYGFLLVIGIFIDFKAYSPRDIFLGINEIAKKRGEREFRVGELYFFCMIIGFFMFSIKFLVLGLLGVW